MKVNLECGQNYLVGNDVKNFDSNFTNQYVARGNFRDLTKLGIPDNSIDELTLGNALEQVHISEIGNLLQHWKSKLKVGGTLYVRANDANMLSTMLQFDQISIDDFNKVIYGQDGQKLNRGIYSLPTMEVFLARSGFTIDEKGFSNFQFWLLAKKV